MSQIVFAISHQPTNLLVERVYRTLRAKERKDVESVVSAVTDSELATAVRPFMFGGSIVHELHFDPMKLLFFTRQERSEQ